MGRYRLICVADLPDNGSYDDRDEAIINSDAYYEVYDTVENRFIGEPSCKEDYEAAMIRWIEHKVLDSEMSRMLILMEVTISYGATANYNASGHTHPDSKPPTGDNNPVHEEFRNKYNAQQDNPSRRSVIDEAQRNLDSWKRQHPEAPVKELSIEQLVIQEGAGHSAVMVGQRWNLSEHHIRRIRKRAGVRADNGESLDAKKLSMADRRREVKRLRGEGKLSLRQIASVVGCSVHLVEKDIRELRRS